MVIRRKSLIWLFYLLILNNISCFNYVPARIKKNFNFCYDSSIIIDSSKIRFDGFYVQSIPFERYNYNRNGDKLNSSLDTIKSNIMFFSNGIVVNQFNGVNCGNCSNDGNKKFLKSVFEEKQLESQYFYNNFKWGIYKIHGDTIKMQIVNHPRKLSPYWYLNESWYKIVGFDKLIPIYIENLLLKNQSSFSHDTSHSIFFKTNFVLKSNTWLKNEHWFYCNRRIINGKKN